MRWHALKTLIYGSAPSSGRLVHNGQSSKVLLPQAKDDRHGRARGGRAMTGETPEELARRLTEEYRNYVKGKAFGEMPSEVFFNRSDGHARIVLEFIFRKAEDRVRILTRALSQDVYGDCEVIGAANDFLNTHPNGKLEILSENPVDRAAHPLLSVLDRAGHKERVLLRFIPANTQKAYKFNFAVADGMHHRFEESRDSRQATVQFGEGGFGKNLEEIFSNLSLSAMDKAA